MTKPDPTEQISLMFELAGSRNRGQLTLAHMRPGAIPSWSVSLSLWTENMHVAAESPASFVEVNGVPVLASWIVTLPVADVSGEMVVCKVTS